MLGPKALLNSTWLLLSVNAALLVAGFALPHGFLPSNLAIEIGIGFGMLCAAYYVYVIRLARWRLGVLVGQDGETLRKKLEKPLLVGSLAQLIFGLAGFVKGTGYLYTESFGHRDEVTYTVYDVYWKARRSNCYKHKFSGLSAPQNFFSGPCLDLGYAPGSRFHFSGRSSSLGLVYDHREIETDEPPRHHKPYR